MTGQGLQCILFMPNPKLIAIGSQYSSIVAAVNDANDVVATYLESHRMMPIRITMGISLGTLFALEIAKRHTEINRVILSAPFGDLDEHVRRWSEHFYFRKVVRSQYTDLQGSVNVLKQIDPLNSLTKLRDKKILLCYASNDNATHTAGAQKLVEQLKENNLDLILRFNKGGHHTGIFKDYWWLMTSQQEIFQV